MADPPTLVGFLPDRACRATRTYGCPSGSCMAETTATLLRNFMDAAYPKHCHDRTAVDERRQIIAAIHPDEVTVWIMAS